MGDPPDYEPARGISVAAIAAREGRTPDEVAYDYMIGAEDRYLFFPVVNYVDGDHEPIREMLTDRHLLGLSDGGAHCTSIVDAGVPSFMLTHWARDRRRGPRLPLELLVKRQTSETADFFGLPDRGRLAPGLRADVNLIDFDRLRLYQPELVHDMPARPPLRPARRRLRGDAGRRHAHLRARRAHRRAARPSGARRPRRAGFARRGIGGVRLLSILPKRRSGRRAPGMRLRPATGYVSMLATIAKPRSSPRIDLAGRPYRYWCHRPLAEIEAPCSQ